MEERITVRMTAAYLYDFMLFHTYSTFSGFLSNVLGLAVFFMGIIMKCMGKIEWQTMGMYMVFGLLFFLYTPALIWYRSKKQIKNMDIYHQPAEYIFGEMGIRTVQGEAETAYTWEQFQKVVATPKNIGFYYGGDNALIIPKEQFGDRFVQVMTIVTAHIPRDRVKIR